MLVFKFGQLPMAQDICVTDRNVIGTLPAIFDLKMNQN